MDASLGDASAPAMERLVAWIESETGLRFPDVHHDTIRKAAERRCDELGLDPEAFEKSLYRDPAEKCRFFNDIMIGETYFFRDEKHFQILVSCVLPELMLQGRELCFWSATCASGEEALSLVAAAEHVKESLGLDVPYRVLASDINMNALVRLEAGAYPSTSFRNDGKPWHGLLERCGAMDGQCWRASPESLKRIDSLHLNLMTGELPRAESLDLVFFRNTLVYMRQEQKARILERIVGTIRPGGYLFLASPEVPTVRHPLLEVMERHGGFFFRRRNAADGAGGIPGAAAREPVRERAGILPARAASSPASGTPSPSAARKPVPRPARAQASLAELDAAIRLASASAKDPGAADTVEAPRIRGLARDIQAISAAISANRFSAADELTARFERDSHESHVSMYLKALSLKHRGHLPEAIELWEKARLYANGFWPALFQAGLACLAANPARARLLLSECVAAMEADRDDGRFFVLLESFDAPYYRRMAGNMLARLDRT